MAPILETVANENPDQVILEVNVDEQEELMARYKIMSIPTLIVFENGEIVKKAIGLQPKNQLEELIK
jgi:thioredoxin 1